ncbi:type II secretion system minor pseudopilin GspI [Salinisphaera sp. Q1T1-3]|uniref:type II secretion system minor pseudopilin GspI n=1 Tax=Salinisphaera sp. Q1T1-3 TaxID=2321229 RepID=UPI000E70DB9C|nr:type II secretion system minor pseudopilin GspI [Salinisphaera sp. Q1T1-3]RJS91760.1 type II secretion system protein GspI [Salinisphaera sp. Q1T1-3]
MKSAARGFTLIEVLIALAVLAIALVAFVSAGAQNADYATYIRDRTIAQWVARNQLVTYQIAADWPRVGTQADDVRMADQTWHWVATIQASPDPQVRRVDIRVYTVDPETGQPADDAVMLLSGFLTQHPKAASNEDRAGRADNNGGVAGSRN